MILNKVKNTINKHGLIKDGDKIVLGLSGGPDSVCLLHILKRLKEEIDIEIYAAHLNHQIRGIEAQKDALYIARLCEQLDITYFIKSIDVPLYCKEHKLSLEEGARKLRYDMFEEIRMKTKSNKIAVGHNLNDQAETIMMRVMRGTGLKGLKGIEHIRDNKIIRPILDVDRSDIEAYCEEYNLNPRIDMTNLENIYTRNKIRLELIPYMKENFNPSVTESIVRMGSSLKEDSDFIEQHASEKFEEVSKIDSNKVEIYIEKYINLHKSIKTRVIQMAIHKILGDTKHIELKHIEDVMTLEGNNKVDKKINLPRGMFVYRTNDTLLFTNEEIKHEEIEFCYNLPNNGFIKIKELRMLVETETVSIEKHRSMKINKSIKCFDFNKIKGGMIVRSRKPGDKIKLNAGSKKIKDLFIDLKIPKDERSKTPLIVDSEGILCVGDYRVSENYKIESNTKEVLKVSFKRL